MVMEKEEILDRIKEYMTMLNDSVSEDNDGGINSGLLFCYASQDVNGAFISINGNPRYLVAMLKAYGKKFPELKFVLEEYINDKSLLDTNLN